MRFNLSIFFVLATVVIDSMGIGLIMPVMPDLIKEVTGEDLSRAAVWGGIMATVFAVMQFLFGPTLGNVSDRYGRRIVLLLSLTVLTADYLLMAIAGTVQILLLARIVGGMASATQATATAYMADISSPEEKSANFGLIGAAFGLGFVLGPFLGGLLGEFGVRAPFFAAAGLVAANLALGYVVLKETVTDDIRRPFEWRRANPVGAFKHITKMHGLTALLVSVFFQGIAFFVYPAVWSFFAQERFGWSPGMVGLSLGLFGIGIFVAQGFLIRPILARISERTAVILGLSIDIAAFVALGFLQVGWIALALTPVIALGSIAGPALSGMMSRRVDDNQQGELMGLLTSINAVAIIIAPLAMTVTFWAFTHEDAQIYLPGAPFLVAAALTGCALAAIASSKRLERAKQA